MGKNSRLRWIRLSAALLALLMVWGCAGMTERRTPQEWLSLSYSGLAALDEFSFAGSLTMGMNEGVMNKPQTFEGKVVDHHQLTLQAEGQHALYGNPADVLARLNRGNDGVAINREGQGDGEFPAEDIIWLQIKGKPEETTERWRQHLRDGLAELNGIGMSAASRETTALREQTLLKAKEELEGMLATLNATSVYQLGIHRKKLLPLKMMENTEFNYKRNGVPMHETRSTSIRFQHF
ncbi:hypothetical protein [Paenibacillus oryzae]|nr:hypothetical protein [Paenibacillus oryzae]